jgi:hypothetical protein
MGSGEDQRACRRDEVVGGLLSGVMTLAPTWWGGFAKPDFSPGAVGNRALPWLARWRVFSYFDPTHATQ